MAFQILQDLGPVMHINSTLEPRWNQVWKFFGGCFSNRYRMRCVELSLKGMLALALAVKGLWYTGIFPVQWPDGYAMLMSPNKGETAVHGCHCPSYMAVRMREVLARPWVGVCVPLALSLSYRIGVRMRKHFWAFKFGCEGSGVHEPLPSSSLSATEVPSPWCRDSWLLIYVHILIN